MIEKRIRALLLDDATIKMAIGNNRLTPVVMRQDLGLPAMTYRRLSGQSEYTLGGRMGWRTVTLEITTWAAEYDAARALAERVRVVLDAYIEQESSGSIRFVSVADGTDDYAAELDAYGCVCILTVEYDDEQMTL